MRYADIILPLGLEGLFTYSVPDSLAGRVMPFVRVVVPLGRSKVYTGLVARLHDVRPQPRQGRDGKLVEVEVKDIIDVIDSAPVLLDYQYRLWQWISEYYLCPIGDVFRAAFPAGMKQEEGYRPKTETYIRLAENYRTEAALHAALNMLRRAQKQMMAFNTYLYLSHYDTLEGDTTAEKTVEITREELINVSRTTDSVVRSLVGRGFLETYEVPVGRLNYHGEYHPEQIKPLSPAQQRAFDDIQSASKPVLLQGVTGSGKTEIYIRLIKEEIERGRQVLYLLPEIALTVQIMQRLQSVFGDRLGIYHSRYSDAERVEIWQRQLSDNPYDVILGARSAIFLPFSRLGLVIIDEEQRFGVAQKERFKEICKNVDVLTLSATPIPRTLNMAMSGIRDMSTLDDAPQDRHPVQTYVLEHDDGIIAEAIRRELRRGGQVFYLHNRVESIERCAARLSSLVPEAKLAIAHGKMSENELSDIWQRMLEQDINLLVCTTIIETGIDLPNANTLIIEDADHMGLSQLHQLRGRVGRSARRAYAYFTFRPQKVLTEISQKRLNAIKEFTEFGSGFKIAMRDLELRGAGNVLGAQQHGHMEDVGYDMYLKLLGEALNEAKGEKKDDYTELECLVDVQVQAHIPESYIESLGQRLDIYKRISDIRTQSDARDVADELIDRFGEPPKSVLGLINVALTRSRAASKGIYEIKQQNSSLLLYTNNIKNPFVGEVISRFKGSAFLNAGSKPYISIKFQSGMTPNEMLKLVFFEDEAANAKK